MLVVHFSTKGVTGKLCGTFLSKKCTWVDMVGALDLVLAFIHFLAAISHGSPWPPKGGWIKVVWGN
jgi:cob(I)alamin adenosyltransferase